MTESSSKREPSGWRRSVGVKIARVPVKRHTGERGSLVKRTPAVEVAKPRVKARSAVVHRVHPIPVGDAGAEEVHVVEGPLSTQGDAGAFVTVPVLDHAFSPVYKALMVTRALIFISRSLPSILGSSKPIT